MRSQNRPFSKKKSGPPLAGRSARLFLIEERVRTPAILPDAGSAFRGRVRSVPVAAAAEPAAAGAVGLRLGFVDLEDAALEIDAVDRADGLERLFPVRHLDEAEASGLAAELVRDDGGFLDRPVGLEGLAEVVFGHAERQVSDINVHTRLL